jgi:DNA repair exonuclease SbcCD nuclease subunit
MRILTIGDLHFKTSNVEESLEMSKEFIRVAEQVKPDLIVVLGDTLDRFSNIHVSPLTRAINLLRSLSQISEMIVLIGNHDLPNNSVFCSKSHPFSSLYEWPSTTIVDTPIKVDIGGYNIIFSPYTPNGRLVEALSTVEEWDKSHILFCHQEFEGCKMGAITSIEGDKWSSEYPHVISGHIHDYQRIGKILYPGTPIQHGYSDSSKKTISLITLTTEGYNEERISLNVTLKRIVHLTPSELSTYQPPKGVKIKISIKATSSEIKVLMSSPYITQLTKLGVTFSYKHEKVDSVIRRPSEVKENYLVELHKSIEGDEKLWFEHIFGTVRL